MTEKTFATLATRFRANTMGALRIACVAGMCVAGAGLQAAQTNDQDYADALLQFRNGRLAEAFGGFTVLANRGDADAARIAIFMYQFGPVLYGRDWDVTPHEAKAWEALAKNGKERQALPILTYLNAHPADKQRLHGTDNAVAGSNTALANKAAQ